MFVELRVGLFTALTELVRADALVHLTDVLAGVVLFTTDKILVS